MSKSEGAARREARQKASTDGGRDLVIYLVVRFILVLVCVMVAESFMVSALSITLVPIMNAALDATPADGQATSSVLALLYRIAVVVGSLANGTYMRAAGVVRGSVTIALILMALVLLSLPPIAGALVFSTMVMRRVRALQDIREQELAKIDRQRAQFMTDVAHDLRTPLMAISGMAQALKDGVVKDDAMRDEYLRSIYDKANKMSGLVSSVFEYTKLEGGVFELDLARVDLPQLLLSEAAVVYSDVEDANMTLSVDVPEDACHVEADRVQLARVVANLITNAMRHNTAGTEIALILVRQAGVAYVIVADTGDPISQDPEELFRPFSRGDAARRDTGGSGLGLSICKRVADMHGFDLTLEQPYGRFTKAFVLKCAVVV